MLSYSNREEAGHSYNQIKAKQQSNSLSSSAFNVWNSFMNFWAPKGLGSSTSPTLPSIAHISCLVISGWLHFIVNAVLSGHLTVLASPVFWHLHWEGGCTSANGLLVSLQGLPLCHTVPRLNFSPWSFQSYVLYCNWCCSFTNGIP